MKSNTVDVLQRFYTIVDKNNISPEEREFIRYYSFSLAKAISEEFREDAVSIAKMILAYYE